VGAIFVRGLNVFAGGAVRLASARPRGLPPSAKAGLLAPYRSWADRIAVHRFVRDVPSSSRHRTWPALARIEEQLPQFGERPVLLVWGMQDWCFRPVCIERLCRALPSAAVHRVETAGHYLLEDAPEEVSAQITRFLSVRRPAERQPHGAVS
jgi:haloalkane dehalogenase